MRGQAGELQAQLTKHLEAGQSDLESAKASLKLANTKHDAKLVIEAKQQFLAAKSQFALTKQTADGSRLLHGIEALPDVGSQARSRHTAVDGVADMGVAISDAGIDLSDLATQIISPATGGQAGRTLLGALDQANASLVKVRGDLQLAKAAAAGVDPSVIPSGEQAAFLSAQATIADAIAGLDEFQLFVPIIKEVLGGNGPRNYLIEQVNPAELRPGGGFIGTYSLLQADEGTLKLVKSGDAYDDLSKPRPVVGQPGYVAPPAPLLSLISTTSWSFIDSNFYPDFASNALAAERFAKPRLGKSIDGVISIDYYTIAKLLELTGPLAIPGYGITVNSDNFISLAIQGDITGSASHKAIVAAAAGPLMQRLSTLPPDRWPSFVTVLNGLASSHNLQAFFNNTAVESQMGQFGWAGSVNPRAAYDFMSEEESNLGATKANYFVTRHYSITLTRSGSILHHVITVQLVNNMPYVYRPNDYYKAYFRFFIPGNASTLQDNLTRLAFADPAAPAGLRQLTGWTTIPGYGNRFTATFAYDTPWLALWRGEHQIYWEKEPGTAADPIDVVWNNGAGNTYKTSGTLSQDTVITLMPTGLSVNAAQSATATLPSLTLG